MDLNRLYVLLTVTWFERVSMLIILLNCITLGMYQPCSDNTHECNTNRCKILQGFDDFIFAFFWLEMTIKMVAMGVYGKGTYLADSWNRLDFFIVLSGALEYCLNVENMNLSAIRTIRVLRPLRAINRIPSMRILVMLLLDTLPMLGNVLLLCFFVFFIFGIVGVQLWQGILRQRCYLRPPDDWQYPPDLSRYYTFSQEQEYICTRGDNSGMHACADLPPYKHGKMVCNGTAIPGSSNEPTNTSCVNWNQYYTECVGNGDNPFQGTISFDNIGLAWVAIFLVISLEGWTDIMYYVQDAHSFWDWIYFVLLIVIGSFFMINLCLVVIATQFSETKKREMERMRLERERFRSTSTLASSTNNSEPTTCYAEIVKYIAHLWRRGKRRILKKYRLYKYERQQRREQKAIEAGIQPHQEISSMLNVGHRKIMFHHPACPRMTNKQVSVTTQAITVQQPLQSISCTAVSGSTSTGGAVGGVGGGGGGNVGLGGVVETISSSSHVHNNNTTNNNNRTTVVTGSTMVGASGAHDMSGSATGSNHNVIGIQPSSCSPHTAGPPSSNDIIVLQSSSTTDGIETAITTRRPGLLRVPSTSTTDSMLNDVTLQLLSPPSQAAARRRSSVMFSDIVLLHGGNGAVSTGGGGSSPGSGSLPQNSVLNPGNITNSTAERNVCSSEKMTQTDPFPLQIKINPELCVSAYSTGDGNIWQISPTIPTSTPGGNLNTTTIAPLNQTGTGVTEYCELNNGETMTCQELLALSGALSAALPTGQIALDSFFNSLTKGINTTQLSSSQVKQNTGSGQPVPTKMYLTSQSQYPIIEEDFSCCQELYEWEIEKRQRRSKRIQKLWCCCRGISKFLRCCKRSIKSLVEQKYFQQGILLAILINTLSMGIEYHNQPEMLTHIVEISNIVLSALFAVEMLLKVIAEGPFGYISNGFNVFDGIIVILSAVELCQSFLHGDRESSGLSVLRTFRLLRILKLVRFMPNLRRQLFVMLRTMDNVAVFFSLLILFIFIFSILGMNLFGCKFCERDTMAEGGECDRKNFDSLLWALVTVFQILTQEDWNMVLSNGMAKTSHWAALYFVALMTFGNYVLFNLLVAILVEGFSSERNERREREQRELAKSKLSQECYHSDPNDMSYDDSRSISESSDSFPHGVKNTWRSAEELRKIKDSNGHRDRYHRDHGQCHVLHGRMAGCRSILQRECSEESKCNIQKESKMLQQPIKMAEYRAASPQPPIITHTAATPQDSPNTTLEPGASFKEFYFNSSFIDSLDSIDKSSCTSIPGLLKPPALNGRSSSLTPPTLGLLPTKQLLYDKLPEKVIQESNITPKLITHNEKNGTRTTTFSEKVYCPIQNIQLQTEKSSNEKNNEKILAEKPIEKNDKCKIQRGYSWKISRPSLRKNKSGQKNRSGSDSDAVLVLNNGRDHSQGIGNSVSRQASLKNSDNAIRIQNDTQGDTPNNKSTKGISPQNSIRSKCSTYSSIPQVAWQQTVHRQNSLTSNNSSQPKICPYNTIYQYQEQRLSLTPENNDAKTINNLNDKVIDCSLPKVNNPDDSSTAIATSNEEPRQSRNPLKKLFSFLEPTGIFKEREEFSLYLFPSDCRIRIICTWLVEQKWFDNVVLMFIALNCITLAMERPNIPPNSVERHFLSTANYVFTVVFAIEMFIKVVDSGMCYGPDAYFTSGWNIMDGSLVIISIIDLLMSIISESSPRIFGILRVFRLLRSLRPLRVINRAPGLKLVVQTLLSSLRPIGNIVLICCTFFIIFGILGVQLFKGTFFYCKGDITKDVRNKTDCTSQGFEWVNQKYNFDDLGKALMSLFVLSSRDGWVNIMYTGLDAVGVDQQPIVNYSEWRLLYFISFILLVGFFVLNMFVGVVVENFHRCREEQEKEERVRRAAKRALQMEKRRRRMNEPPYYTNYSKWRLFIHNVCTSKYFDLAIAAVIGLNVVTMAMECYKMPDALEYALKIFNYFFTAVFILESVMKLIALGLLLYLKDKWNQLDVFIVILSVVGIVLEELRSKIIPINPTVLRVMRVLRIARVLKLLKMAKGIRALLDTVMQALPQVGNLGLLFFLLFFIFAALGVELFGRLECSDENPCQGLGEHAHFSNFGMAFLTLFRVATGDNWNGIMKDTLRDNCDEATDCVKNCCVSTIIAPIFFVIFVLMAQFVLVNVVVAVLMKHLEESHKHLEDETDMDLQLEREMQEIQEEQEERELCLALQMEVESRGNIPLKKTLTKVLSLPSNFTYNPPDGSSKIGSRNRRQSVHGPRYNTRRRQTFHSQQALLPNIISGRNVNYNNKYDNSDFNYNDENIIYEKSVHNIEQIVQDNDKIIEDVEQLSSAPKNNDLSTIISESIEEDAEVKNINENKKTSLLNVPCVQKPVHKLYGSTKHLFKQKAIEEPAEEDVNEEDSLLSPKELLPVPIVQKAASDTVLLRTNENNHPVLRKQHSDTETTVVIRPELEPCDHTKHAQSEEDIQKIISERRQQDETMKEVLHFDIFESPKIKNIDTNNCSIVQNTETINSSVSDNEDIIIETPQIDDNLSSNNIENVRDIDINNLGEQNYHDEEAHHC